MKPTLIPLLACALSLAPLPLTAQFQTGDDFTDPARDIGKWGLADLGTGDSEWVESGGRMNFVATPSFFLSTAHRRWAAQAPGYAADWQAGVDVELGSIALFEEEGVDLALSVCSTANPDLCMRVSLFTFQFEFGSTTRRLQVEVTDSAGNVVARTDEAYTPRNARLRFSYDSNSRMLLAGVADTGGAVRIVAGWNTSNWGMKDNEPFQVAVVGTAIGASIASGAASADNFAITQQGIRSRSALEGTDNFNDNIRSAATWGPYDSVYGMGTLKETGATLVYSTLAESGLPFDGSSRRWSPGAGDMSQPWTAQVDVSLPNLTLSESQEVEIGLEVVNLADPGDRAALSLAVRNVVEQSSRLFRSSIERDAQPFPELALEIATDATSAALRLRWEPSGSRLHLEYDSNGPVGGYVWSALGSHPVNTGDSSWELAGGSRFQIGAYARSSWGAMVPEASQVRLDNFQLTPGTSPVVPVKIVSYNRSGKEITLKWEGGKGPYQVQRRDTVSSGTWTNVGVPVNTLSANVGMTGSQGYFRILDLGQ